MQVLELADEFHLTTADAVEICVAAGVADADRHHRARPTPQTDRWRAAGHRPPGVARAQRAGRPSARGRRSDRSRRPRGSRRPTARRAGPPTAPTMNPTDAPPLGAGWGTGRRRRRRRISPYAPAALALAVVSLIFPFVPGFGALALAWYAKGRIERSRGRLTGERIATAAQVVAGIGIALWVLLSPSRIYQRRPRRRRGPRRRPGRDRHPGLGRDRRG